MPDQPPELDRTSAWFRERLGELIKLGGAAFIIITGWLISTDSVISLDQRSGEDRIEAAVFLCVAMPLVWAIWYVALLRIHTRCPDHPTVLRRRLVHAYAIAVGVGLGAVLYLAVDGPTLW